MTCFDSKSGKKSSALISYFEKAGTKTDVTQGDSGIAIDFSTEDGYFQSLVARAPTDFAAETTLTRLYRWRESQAQVNPDFYRAYNSAVEKNDGEALFLNKEDALTVLTQKKSNGYSHSIHVVKKEPAEADIYCSDNAIGKGILLDEKKASDLAKALYLPDPKDRNGDALQKLYDLVSGETDPTKRIEHLVEPLLALDAEYLSRALEPMLDKQLKENPNDVFAETLRDAIRARTTEPRDYPKEKQALYNHFNQAVEEAWIGKDGGDDFWKKVQQLSGVGVNAKGNPVVVVRHDAAAEELREDIKERYPNYRQFCAANANTEYTIRGKANSNGRRLAVTVGVGDLVCSVLDGAGSRASDRYDHDNRNSDEAEPFRARARRMAKGDFDITPIAGSSKLFESGPRIAIKDPRFDQFAKDDGIFKFKFTPMTRRDRIQVNNCPIKDSVTTVDGNGYMDNGALSYMAQMFQSRGYTPGKNLFRTSSLQDVANDIIKFAKTRPNMTIGCWNIGGHGSAGSVGQASGGGAHRPGNSLRAQDEWTKAVLAKVKAAGVKIKNEIRIVSCNVGGQLKGNAHLMKTLALTFPGVTVTAFDDYVRVSNQDLPWITDGHNMVQIKTKQGGTAPKNVELVELPKFNRSRQEPSRRGREEEGFERRRADDDEDFVDRARNNRSTI